MKEGYIRSLDGVRALAILLVMAFHAHLIKFGWIGVQLFFVLSGFLITRILWQDKFREESLSSKWKRFLVRRSLRIFPLYFLYLIGIGLVYLVLSFPSYYPTYAPYLFTYTVNYTRLFPEWQGNPLFTHLWSLSIEEQFYLFFPLLVYLLPGRWVKIILVALIILTPLTRYFLFQYFNARTSSYIAADAVYWHTLSHLDAFFLGGLIPVFSLHQKWKHTGLLLAGSILLALVCGLVYYYSANTSGPWWLSLGFDHAQVERLAYVWQYTVLDLVFFSLVLFLAARQHRQGKGFVRLLEHPVLVRIGQVSYGMYIFHWLVLVYIIDRLVPGTTSWSRLLIFLPYVLLVYLIAELSYSFFETHFMKMKKKFGGKGS
jgi:peptidoglycan/LPS O-acetylase OafA/YrhL